MERGTGQQGGFRLVEAAAAAAATAPHAASGVPASRRPSTRGIGGLAAAIEQAAFTLIEIVISLAVLGTMSGGAYIGFTAINQYSVSSRLYSQAQTVAQNQIDLILSAGPFDLNVSPQKIPAVLALGTTVKNNVFIYEDPETGEVLVRGKMTTEVTDTNKSMTLEGITTNLNLRRCTVTVSYKYRNTDYAVKLDTMRTADR
jgi:prepilin-type N-terminal cleavage/methylation domain-containing protein